MRIPFTYLQSCLGIFTCIKLYFVGRTQLHGLVLVYRKQVVATKADADRDGVKVPTTLAEYCVRTRAPPTDEGTTLFYDDYYDDEDLDDDDDDDDEGGDCCYDEDDSGTEDS